MYIGPQVSTYPVQHLLTLTYALSLKRFLFICSIMEGLNTDYKESKERITKCQQIKRKHFNLEMTI